MQNIAIMTLLAALGAGLFLRSVEETQLKDRNCDVVLEQAQSYDMTNDLRAEAAYRSVALSHGRQCPRVYLYLSSHLSRNLKFREAAEMMDVYVKRVSPIERVFDAAEVRKLKHIAELQLRVTNAHRPRLPDLLEFTRQVRAYAKSPDHAIEFAEKAVNLYPNSVAAILLLVDTLPRTSAEKQRVEQLLNRAAAIQPRNANIYSARGWLNLRTYRQLDGAERDFRQALLISGGANASAWKGLGFVLMERKQNEAALAALRKYLRVRKSSAADHEVIQSIENLQRVPE